MRSVLRAAPLLFSLVVGGLLVVPSTQAQDRDGIDVDWDVSAGAVSSTFQGNTRAFAGEGYCGPTVLCVSPSPEVRDRRVGVQVGAGVQTPIADWAVARAEVRYRQVGGTVRHQTIRFRERHAVQETADYTFHTLQIPVLAEATSRVERGVLPVGLCRAGARYQPGLDRRQSDRGARETP